MSIDYIHLPSTIIISTMYLLQISSYQNKKVHAIRREQSSYLFKYKIVFENYAIYQTTAMTIIELYRLESIYKNMIF